jgi:hypothetical protein
MPTTLRLETAPVASRFALDPRGAQESSRGNAGAIRPAPPAEPLAASVPAPGREANIARSQSARAAHAGVNDAVRAQLHRGSVPRPAGLQHVDVVPTRAFDRAEPAHDVDDRGVARDIASSMATQAGGFTADDVERLLQRLGFDGRSLSSIDVARDVSDADVPVGLDLEQLLGLVGAALQRERGAGAPRALSTPGSGSGVGDVARGGSGGSVVDTGRGSGGVQASGQPNDATTATTTTTAATTATTAMTSAGRMSGLLSFIAAGEGGYNSMNQGTRGGRIVGSTHNAASKLGKDLTDMTIGEVMAAQRSGRLFAAGRYQIIPSTMQGIVGAAGLSMNDKFSPENQDRLGVALIEHKRPYAYAYITGQHDDRRGAMLALAQEWASLPDPRTGRSFYGNGNRSSHTVAAVATAIDAARRAWQADRLAGPAGASDRRPAHPVE